MGKKGKKAAAGKPKKLTPKDIGKRLDALVKKLEEELKDADLFAPLPPMDDCAICLMPLSRVPNKSYFKTCCGKTICDGCAGESDAFNVKNEVKSKPRCPFCREPEPTSSEEVGVRRLEARALKNDYEALCSLGRTYEYGENGFPKDELKALDYYIRAADLGSADGCTGIADSYEEGNGISVDKRRAGFFNRVGASRGSIKARHNIGISEYIGLGNHETAIRHWKIAAEAGFQPSLNILRDIYNADGKMPGKEFISKEELDRIYRVCHDAQEEVKSEEREKHGEYGTSKFKC